MLAIQPCTRFDRLRVVIIEPIYLILAGCAGRIA